MPQRSPHHLTTADLVHRVRALSPNVAVFDCDGTLWSGDAGSTFMWWSMDTHLVSPEQAQWLRGRYEEYRRGAVSEVAICGEMVQVYAGLHELTLRDAAAVFFQEQIAPNIFPSLRQLVAELQQGGTELWAVSSTNRWVIEEGVRGFGIPADHVLAANVDVRDGVLTDRILAVPTDEGKVEALHRAGVLAPDAVFGNSVHDAAMLAIARAAFPVNPTSALEEQSAARGWAVYHPPVAGAPPSDMHV